MIALRPYTPADRDHFVSLFTDGEVSGYVGGPRSAADSAELFSTLCEGRHERALAAYAVTLEGDMVGHGALFRHAEADTLELGYMIDRRYWRRGIGTETARELCNAARDLGAKTAIGTVDLENVASQIILERLGGKKTLTRDEEGEFFAYRIALASR